MAFKTRASFTITKIDQYYTWIKYSDHASGMDMSDDPTNKKYMGIAQNQLSPTESTDPRDYTWSRIRGIDTKASRIESTRGFTIKKTEDKSKITKLTARIYDGEVEYDPDGTELDYTWYESKVNDETGEGVELVLSYQDKDGATQPYKGKTISITLGEIVGKKVFFMASTPEGGGRTTARLGLARLGSMRLGTD